MQVACIDMRKKKKKKHFKIQSHSMSFCNLQPHSQVVMKTQLDKRVNR